MMDELYVLAYFDDDGNFVEFIRKGRNRSISGYDSIGAARRGLGQSKGSYRSQIYIPRIVKANGLEVVE